MEQHKVLLIIVSVAIVLAAVVGIGLWLYYPRADKTDVADAADQPAGGFEWQPLDYLQGQGEAPGLDVTEADPVEEPDEFEVTYGVAEAEEPPVEIGDTPVEPTVAPSAAVAVVDATATEISPISDEPAVLVRAAEPEAAVARVVTETSPSVVATDSDQAVLADRAYWVQAISSPNRDTVEQARLVLRDHHLGSRILSKDIDGRTYYRLRIGPFAVRAEAEKFLGWVQDIDGFADSMIFVDYSTPVLAARP